MNKRLNFRECRDDLKRMLTHHPQVGELVLYSKRENVTEAYREVGQYGFSCVVPNPESFQSYLARVLFVGNGEHGKPAIIELVTQAGVFHEKSMREFCFFELSGVPTGVFDEQAIKWPTFCSQRPKQSRARRGKRELPLAFEFPPSWSAEGVHANARRALQDLHQEAKTIEVKAQLYIKQIEVALQNN